MKDVQNVKGKKKKRERETLEKEKGNNILINLFIFYRNNDCKRNKNDCQFVREEEEEDNFDDEIDVRNNNNNNNGKPKYANCEKFFGWQVKEIFKAANDLLGGCSSCGSKRKIERNNGNCVRNNKCRKSEEERNNKVSDF
jgi:hypothetical protein